ncbi:MAG: polysaccharide biosynthesis tyrosine autokinase [Bacteroidia bacterium]|nr:polysaccharide biosynthesis tyrosine autokinase [Bacteroidia bacterium]
MFQSSKMNNQYSDDTIDVKALLGRFVRRWYFFAIGVVLALGLAFVQIKFSTKIYRVKAKVILGNQNAATVVEDMGTGVFMEQSDLEDKIGVLRSFNLIQETVKKMDVGVSYYSYENFKAHPEYKDVPFTVVIDSTQEQLVGIEIFIEKTNDVEYRVKAKGESISLYDIKNSEIIREIEKVDIDEKVRIGEPYKDNLLSFRVNFKEDYETYTRDQYFFKINTLDGLAELFQTSLKIEPVSEESNILSITSEGPLIEVEKKFINLLLEAYRQKELDEMNEVAMRTIVFLDSQIQEFTGKIETTQTDLTASMVNSGVIDAGTSEAQVGLQISQLERERTDISAAVNYYERTLANIENAGPDDHIELAAPSMFNINEAVLNSLIIKLSQLYEEEADLIFQTNKKGPLWEVNQLKIKNTRRDIVANVRSGLEAQKNRLASSEEQLRRLYGKRGSIPAGLAAKYDLERALASGDARLRDLLDKRDQAYMAMKSQTVDIEIIENAKMEGRKPVSPQKTLIILIALFAGLGLPVVVIVVKDFLNDKISGHADIESSTNIPVLGFVARHDRNSNYIVPKDSRTALAESFRSIRIKMQYLNDNAVQQIIGLTSSSSGEGKTFCATNLAAVMAQAGKRTLLVDMDLRRPRVTRYFENGDGRGLSSYLSGEVKEHKDIVHKTHIENLDVVHSGPVCTNPLDLIATDRMRELIQKLREQYDHVVFDTPPVGLVSDYLVIMKMTDFNIYVVRDSTTSVESLKWINELYDTEKIKNVGMLINDVKSVAAYGYIDSHYGYGD